MSEELRPSAVEGEADRRARASLRVLPNPDSAQGRAEIVAAAWARESEQDDWCVDASPALQAGCAVTDLDAATMPASERRAVHMTRQRIRAQAVLAAAEPGPEAERRERARRRVIVVGSALLHLAGFAVLANAVADLRVEPRPETHEHLFEARAIVPIELEPAVPAEPEQSKEGGREAAVEVEPTPARKPKPGPAEPTAEPASEASAAPIEAAPPALRGIEFSSEDGSEGGSEGGSSGGSGALGQGGRGSGSGQGSGTGHGDGGGSSASGPGKSDVDASPRGGLIEPEYPAELERQGIEGSVLVKVWIDEHGHVIKAEVANSSGHESFDHNALMAAQRQEWDAALQGGEPVASTRRYRVHFKTR